MKPPFVELPLVHCRNGRGHRVTRPVVRETFLELRLNDEPLVEIACAGIHVEELALGYLKSEGLIDGIDDVAGITVEESPPRVSLTTTDTREAPSPTVSIMSSGAGKRTEHVAAFHTDSGPALSPVQICSLMDRLLEATTIHTITRGTHCSGLAMKGELLCTREDIGRHNTVDMIVGYTLKERIHCGQAALLTTGRISAEIVGKALSQGFPVIISHSVPTSGAVDSARRSGMTLVGYVRNSEFRVYTHESRVIV
ncbi:MAG: formate dehydrogenase accessory sulfurtransferase FdhD [Syntrophales bacterium]|jgi:FdhD protein|nr:formate dehydrogenase accessory sulfurtransferase FdhD [Syntrophales bacterium]MCK9528605.1 formate dehydrogenase accessory sulfurtransferase FdhD [Syntrophales bacterium]MDX9923046.1 formate dehydrogenase accessory sulfurtransferase FdhD [Syntrophales bacterium]